MFTLSPLNSSNLPNPRDHPCNNSRNSNSSKRNSNNRGDLKRFKGEQRPRMRIPRPRTMTSASVPTRSCAATAARAISGRTARKETLFTLPIKPQYLWNYLRATRLIRGSPRTLGATRAEVAPARLQHRWSGWTIENFAIVTRPERIGRLVIGVTAARPNIRRGSRRACWNSRVGGRLWKDLTVGTVGAWTRGNIIGIIRKRISVRGVSRVARIRIERCRRFKGRVSRTDRRAATLHPPRLLRHRPVATFGWPRPIGPWPRARGMRRAREHRLPWRMRWSVLWRRWWSRRKMECCPGLEALQRGVRTRCRRTDPWILISGRYRCLSPSWRTMGKLLIGNSLSTIEIFKILYTCWVSIHSWNIFGRVYGFENLIYEKFFERVSRMYQHPVLVTS